LLPPQGVAQAPSSLTSRPATPVAVARAGAAASGVRDLHHQVLHLAGAQAGADAVQAHRVLDGPDPHAVERAAVDGDRLDRRLDAEQGEPGPDRVGLRVPGDRARLEHEDPRGP
jgi:hypothetical protein